MRNKVHFLLSKIFDYSFHFHQGSSNVSTGSSDTGSTVFWNVSGSQTFIKTIFSDTRTVSFDCFRIDAFWLVLNLEFCFVQPCCFIGTHFKLWWILINWLSKGQLRSLEVISQNRAWNRLFKSARSSSETPLHNLNAISHFELFQNLAP